MNVWWVLLAVTALIVVATWWLRRSTVLSKLTSDLVAVKTKVEDLPALRDGLTRLEANLKARHDLEQKLSQDLNQINRILTGTQTKGQAGENLIREQLKQFPASWVVQNFRVRNQVVEFALRLPNGKVVPIDVKWPASDLLTRLEQATDDTQRQRLRDDIEKVVMKRASEVAQYLDPSQTWTIAVCAVPDAVYNLLHKARSEAYRYHRVNVVAYSLVMPYLLTLYDLYLQHGGSLDLEQLMAHLGHLEQNVADLQRMWENQVEAATVRLTTASKEFGKIRGAILGSIASMKLARLQRKSADGLDVTETLEQIATHQEDRP